MKKVNIVTVTYNLIKAKREKFIKECLESVHMQDYKNIEHIIIDGASDDGTLDILKEYEEKEWIKLYSEKDDGIYFAMNKGVEVADGDYILFLNSDDFMTRKDGVRKSVEVIEKNNADFSYASCNFLDENEKYSGTLKPFLGAFFICMPFCHQTLLCKKELVKFDTDYRSSADFDFVLSLFLRKYKGVFCSSNFISYRDFGTSFVNQDLSIKERCEIYKKHYGIDDNEAKELFDEGRFSKKVLEYILDNVSKEVRKEFLGNIKNKGEFYEIKKTPHAKKTLFR